MAYKDSEELKSDESYALGQYSFRIERASVPGSSNDQLTAICTQGGKNARKSIQIASSTQMSGWYVEANGTTADVYAVVKIRSSEIQDVSLSEVNSMQYSYGPWGGYYWPNILVWADFHARVAFSGLDTGQESPLTLGYDSAKDVYWGNIDLDGKDTDPIYGPATLSAYNLVPQGHASEYTGEEKTMLVGRFAIELEDAGGVGPGSDWDDPGDWDDDWEPGEPTHTLNVEIDGALSGRHNDPLNDTSYSYIPADKDTVKDYGCGGDGGNGGGGGGGASSIVVYKFATDKANWKEIVCKPKRHGYGSGGGKGGKGGDGCILVYY